MDLITILYGLFVLLNTTWTLFHCFLIRYDTTKTSKNLLKLTKSSVFFLFLASIMMCLTQLTPSTIDQSLISIYKDIIPNDTETLKTVNNIPTLCLCTLWWKPCILFYTLGCYFAKFVVMKRMILIVQSPLFDSHRSNILFIKTPKRTNGTKNSSSNTRQLTKGMKLTMLTYLVLLTVIQGVILTNIGGKCEYDINDTNNYNCECVLNYDVTVIILAIVHIIFDAAALLLFFVQFHSTMSAISDVTTKSLFIQLLTVCIALVSCCTDLIVHATLSNDNNGLINRYCLSLFVQIDIFIIINCEIFSLSKAQKWLFRLIGIKRFDKYYNDLDKDQLNVF